MGDFNSIVNLELDRMQNTERRGIKRSPLLNWLKRQDFQDTFRFINPRAEEYTWSNGETSTRIDQIWVSDNVLNVINNAITYD